MDTHTIFFTLPYRTGPEPPQPFPTAKSATTRQPSHGRPLERPVSAVKEFEAVQQLCRDIADREGCHIDVTQAAGDPTTDNEYNFRLAGRYSQVMAARGAVIRGVSHEHQLRLEMPLRAIVDDSNQIIADVRRRMDDIERDTRASIDRMIESNQREASIAGLRLEQTCALLLKGSMEGVELARMRLLVMLDELSGAHAATVDMPHKLQNVVAGRLRTTLLAMQEATNTRIYLPTPLVGVLEAPRPIDPSNGLLTPASLTRSSSQQSNGAVGQGYSPGPAAVHAFNNGLAQSEHMLGPQMTGTTNMSAVGSNSSEFSSPNNGFPPQPHPHAHQYPVRPLGQSIHPHRPAPHFRPESAHQLHAHGNGHPGGWHPPPYGGFPDHAPPAPSSMSGGAGSRRPSPLHTPQHHHQPLPANGWGRPPPPPPPTFVHAGHLRGPGNPAYLPYPSAPPGMYTSNGSHRPNLGITAGSRSHDGHPAIHQGGYGLTSAPHMGGGFAQPVHPGISAHGPEEGMLGLADQVWITGEYFAVQHVKDTLTKMIQQKVYLLMSQDVSILPRKLDWLLTQRLDNVRHFMRDNGTYVQVPTVGSLASVITVFGDHRVNIQRTIRKVMGLVSEHYVAEMWFHTTTDSDRVAPPAAPVDIIADSDLQHIAHQSGAEIASRGTSLDIFGPAEAVRTAVQAIASLDAVQAYHQECLFRIELAVDQREFVAGKKNGKMNNITRLSGGAQIRFESLNEHNFLIELSGQQDAAATSNQALSGLALLQAELPSELSFRVPDVHHKRIIGVGGRTIQVLMRDHGVFVKFSNADEHALFGGYVDGNDNVVARTPAKNAAALDSMLQGIMQLVPPRDRDFTTITLPVPRKYSRSLLGPQASIFRSVERNTGCRIQLLEKDAIDDVISIHGPAVRANVAATMLLDCVPFEAEWRLPTSMEEPPLSSLCASPHFTNLAETIRRDWAIGISYMPGTPPAHPPFFLFRCMRSRLDRVGLAADALEQWLRSQDVTVLHDSDGIRQDDSFADAMAHFNCKIAAEQNASAAEPQLFAPVMHSIRSDNTGPVSTGRALGMHNLPRRPPPSEVEVKALFDGQAAMPATSMTPHSAPIGNAPLFRPGGGSAPLSAAGPLPFPSGLASDVWQPPSLTSTVSSPPPIGLDAPSRETGPRIADRKRQASMAAGVPSSIGRGYHHPRGMTARTQSLDMGSRAYPYRSLSGSLYGNAPGFASPLVMAEDESPQNETPPAPAAATATVSSWAPRHANGRSATIAGPFAASHGTHTGSLGSLQDVTGNESTRLDDITDGAEDRAF